MSNTEKSPVSRRSVVRTAAWSVPAVAVVTAAPAFAASTTPTCKPTGCKFPGRSNKKKVKSYRLETGCGAAEVKAVFINGKTAIWDGRFWWLRDQSDSRSPLPVAIHFKDGTVWNGVVKFLPCDEKDC